MKLPNWFKIIWWFFLLITLSGFLYFRLEQFKIGTATTADVFIFLVWVALCLLPLIEEMSFFGITLKKEIEKLRSDFTAQITNLKTEIKSTINFQIFQPISGQVVAAAIEKKPKKETDKSLMEYKILNTLFTKQVNKYPDFDQQFTFTLLPPNPEIGEFYASIGKLLGEELIAGTNFGQFHLTHKGWDWCKDNYVSFPSNQWWPEETLNSDNLKKVLEKHTSKSH